MFQLCILARRLCSFFLGVNDGSPRLLKTRPFSVFMLLGWNEISTSTDDTVCYQDLVQWSWMQCSLLKPGAATADLTSCPEQSCWSFSLVLNTLTRLAIPDLTMLAGSAVCTQSFHPKFTLCPFIPAWSFPQPTTSYVSTSLAFHVVYPPSYSPVHPFLSPCLPYLNVPPMAPANTQHHQT